MGILFLAAAFSAPIIRRIVLAASNSSPRLASVRPSSPSLRRSLHVRSQQQRSKADDVCFALQVLSTEIWSCNLLRKDLRLYFWEPELVKEFREIRTIDAVIITHSHADAIGGLDDLRDWTNNVQPSVPIYVPLRDFEVMKKTHYYIVDTSVIIPGAAVSQLQFNIINEEPFFVHDLKVIPLPVWHGQGYRSLGYRFGNICYISDVSDIPEETYHLLQDCELLILDALRPDRSSSTHFGLPRAVEEVRKIRPKRTLFTGMMHLMDHDKVNEDLSKLMESEGLDVQLSYDGLRVPVEL